MKKLSRFLLTAGLLALLLSLSLCFAVGDGDQYHCLDDLEGQRIGVLTGSTFDATTTSYYKEAEVVYYNTIPDLATALAANKIDGFLMDEPISRTLEQSVPGITFLPEFIETANYALALAPKNQALKEELDAYIETYIADGRLQAADEKWFSGDDSLMVMEDYRNYPATNGTITMACDGGTPPFCYLSKDLVVGYDIQLIADFCKDNGYALDVDLVEVSALIAAVASNKYDMCCGCINVTPERQESMLFSTPNYVAGVVMMVRGTPDAKPMPQYATAADLEGKTFGTINGSTLSELLKANGVVKDFEVVYTQDITAGAEAVSTGKIDVFITDMPQARALDAQFEDLVCQEDVLLYDSYGIALTKDNPLTSEVNAIIAEMQADGTMDAICDTWFSGDVTGLHLPDLDFSTATKGTLTLGLANTSPPMAYVGAGGEVLGSDVAMMTEIAYRMGYKLELVPMDFSSLIPGLASGKLDMAVGGISITDERKKSVDLTDTYLEGGVVALVRDLNAVEKEVSFLDGLKASFVKSFITENRYELILEGIGVTLIITICSALLGSILGFLICLLRRSKRKPLSMLGKLYIGLVQGTPTMVLLMLLYFVVFADSSLDAVVVAIFGFALSFSAYVSEMMRTGIDAVDGGQIEAAQAIGFTKMQTFWKITFPQAARHFLPVYRGEFISMMKMTSVVGYITIQDLTKMSDIIRSRTYEAFFPLIVTALIYLVLSYFLIAILSYLERKIDPKRRKRIVKGVTAQ